MDLIFDIETNGFLDTLTTIHCIWAEDVSTGQRWDFGPGQIAEGVKLLQRADRLIGHNIIKFDIPAINKLFKGAIPLTIDTVGHRIVDTLVCSRLIWADIRESDAGLKDFPGKLTGSHALKAWGYRLGVLKGTYAETTEGDVWAAWTPEMHAYCGQDITVTSVLWKRIEGKSYAQAAIFLEHRFAFIMALMETNGFGFDERGAVDLYTQLVAKRQDVGQRLLASFPPEVITETTISKSSNKTTGRIKGQPFTKTKIVPFNPSSRQQIAKRLQALGWEPIEFTDNGQPKIDETVLAGLPYPEAKVLAEHFLIEKRIGQIAEGDQAWLKLAKEDRKRLRKLIHGSINPNGAVTGRCTHSRPNVSQVPKVGSPYGEECRGLFGPTRAGWVQVGIDLSGLELRCLAHFMAAFDGGAYGVLILEGDVHWANVLAMGLALGERDDVLKLHKIVRNGAKTFIYAFLYGCGDAKAGTTVYDIILALKDAGLEWEALQLKFFNHLQTPTDRDFMKAGKKLKASFLKKTPALDRLRTKVAETVKEKGYLRGLDGRKLRVRSAHAALNTLLQSAGALIAKLATVLAFTKLHNAGLLWGRDWALMAHVHDEMQIECSPEIADQVGKIVVEAMEETGRLFGFRVPITGEYKVGNNWKDTH